MAPARALTVGTLASAVVSGLLVVVFAPPASAADAFSVTCVPSSLEILNGYTRCTETLHLSTHRTVVLTLQQVQASAG